MKKLPTGIETYEVLAKECYYVDKTEFIEKIDAFPTTSAILITRPRRFGKSTALSMVKCFYEKGEYYSEDIFDDTYIKRKGGAIWKQRGRYPVIYLNFKNLSPLNFEDLKKELGDALRLEYARHPEIKAIPLDASDSDYINKVESNSLDHIDLGHGLSNLIRFLECAHSEKVIVIIDEYDGLIQEAASNSEFYDKSIALFKTFYGTALKGNPRIRFSLLTGVFEIAKDSLTSSLNNPSVYTVLDDGFSKYFGFTEEETKAFLSYFGYEDKYNDALAWYGGYHFGSSTIINPWSLIRFIANSCKTGPYWTNTTRKTILSKVLFSSFKNNRSMLLLLKENGGVTCPIDQTITYQDLEHSETAFISILTLLGYLTPMTEIDIGVYRLQIPNKEVEIIIQREILSHYFSAEGFDILFDFKTALSTGDGAKIKSILEKTILPAINYPGFGSEALYQGMILSLLSLTHKEAIIDVELPSGDGRCDILVQPKNPNMAGMCIELKHLKGRTAQNRLSASANLALEQIQKTNYEERLRRFGVSKILFYGISVAQKNIEVVYRESC